MPLSLRNVLDEAVKFLILLNFDPRVLFCAKEKETHMQYFCRKQSIMAVSGESMPAIIWAVSRTNCFFHRAQLSLKELADQLWLFILGHLQTFSQKWMKWACYFKNNTDSIIANDTSEHPCKHWAFQKTYLPTWAQQLANGWSLVFFPVVIKTLWVLTCHDFIVILKN